MLFGFLIMSLTSCSSSGPEEKIRLSRVSFVADANANSGTPFQVHIVAAYNDTVLSQLRGMSHTAYFNNVSDLERDNRGSLQIFKYDIVPGTRRGPIETKLNSYSKARGVFVFAKYNAQGRFMENIGTSYSAVVKFMANSMSVTTAASSDSDVGR